MKSSIEFKIKTFSLSISFGFLSIITLMFILDNKLNALMSVSAIVLHELSHIAALALFGGKLNSVSLMLCHLNISAYKDELSKSARAFIALSGPLTNLILGITMQGVNKEFSAVNFAIGFFQLLPITSLDGDSALEALGLHIRARKIISITLAFVFALLGFAILLNSSYNFSVLIISMYLLFITLKLQ